jgi:hypothetical protein
MDFDTKRVKKKENLLAKKRKEKKIQIHPKTFNGKSETA